MNVLEMFQLDGAVAIVTGGATGLGLQMATAPAIAVPLAGFVFDALRTYTPVFVVTAAIAVVSGTALMKLPGKAMG